MSRTVGSLVENNLSRGLITEATGLNFPENAVTDTINCVFDRVGSVRRRMGFDLEADAETLPFDVEDGVVKEFLWQTVGLDGSLTILCVQVGRYVFFYKINLDDGVSAGLLPSIVPLENYAAPGAGDIRYTPSSFAAGHGKLFITHPSCDPIAVQYIEETALLQQVRVQIMIRDIEGVEDDHTVTQRPSQLTSLHHYNLRNQGWNQYVRVGDNSSENEHSAPSNGKMGNELFDFTHPTEFSYTYDPITGSIVISETLPPFIPG